MWVARLRVVGLEQKAQLGVMLVRLEVMCRLRSIRRTRSKRVR